MRALWTGSLSFGLVNIPVKLYSATQDRALKFRMLHGKDESPITYSRICEREGKEVPYEEIAKGYEHEKGDFVVLDKKDFEGVDQKLVKTIDVKAFVKEDDIEAKYFEKPYYLEPDKKAVPAYVLLREALRKAKKVGIATFVIHQREHLGMIKPEGNLLMLEQLRYADELRDAGALDVPEKATIPVEEMKLAQLLIDQRTRPFQAEEYRDTYTESLEAIIAAKVKGRKPKKKGAAPQPTQVSDIMAMLRESLEQIGRAHV